MLPTLRAEWRGSRRKEKTLRDFAKKEFRRLLKTAI